MTSTQRLAALARKLTEFAYGDRIVRKVLADGNSSKKHATTVLVNRWREAQTLRAARAHIDPARVGGVGARNRIAKSISYGRSAPVTDHSVEGLRKRMERGLPGALDRLAAK